MAWPIPKATPRLGGEEVYVAAVPLRAAKGLPQMLTSAAFSLNVWELQHFMVIVKPAQVPHFQVLVYDFQPKDPESIYAALDAFSGKSLEGVLHTRTLSKLPRKKCWFVGAAIVDARDAASEFNRNWHTDLRVGQHDCRDYTNGLVECLTGEKHVLNRLRRSNL